MVCHARSGDKMATQLLQYATALKGNWPAGSRTWKAARLFSKILVNLEHCKTEIEESGDDRKVQTLLKDISALSECLHASVHDVIKAGKAEDKEELPFP